VLMGRDGHLVAVVRVADEVNGLALVCDTLA
jgi:hypothetical protein